MGEDLVNHCVNDILVHGARRSPSSTTSPPGSSRRTSPPRIVAGVARGCRAHEMTLVGGETAELPDLFQPAHYDLAGTISAWWRRRPRYTATACGPAIGLIGFESNGLHTNGYTLARHIVFERLNLDVADPFPETDRSVAQVLLDVHRSYAAALTSVLPRIHALAHITGGGIAGNLVRVLPDGCEAVVDAAAWPWPIVFRVLMRAGQRVARRNAARLQSGDRHDRGGGAGRCRGDHARRGAGEGARATDRRSVRGPHPRPLCRAMIWEVARHIAH